MTSRSQNSTRWRKNVAIGRIPERKTVEAILPSSPKGSSKTRMRRGYWVALLLLSCVSVMVGEPGQGSAGDDACPRPAPGSIVQTPPELHSQNGRLEFTLNFRISEDTHGLIRYCYWSDSGLQ